MYPAQKFSLLTYPSGSVQLLRTPSNPFVFLNAFICSPHLTLSFLIEALSLCSQQPSSSPLPLIFYPVTRSALPHKRGPNQARHVSLAMTLNSPSPSRPR